MTACENDMKIVEPQAPILLLHPLVIPLSTSLTLWVLELGTSIIALLINQLFLLFAFIMSFVSLGSLYFLFISQVTHGLMIVSFLLLKILFPCKMII